MDKVHKNIEPIAKSVADTLEAELKEDGLIEGLVAANLPESTISDIQTRVSVIVGLNWLWSFLWLLLSICQFVLRPKGV